MVTFLYHKQIQRIQAKDQSVLLIFMKDQTVYSSLSDVSVGYESISGFFEVDEEETEKYKLKISEFESRQY